MIIMKKTLHIFISVLLLAGLTASAQIKRGKQPSTLAKPKTEQTKKKQSTAAKSNKTSKTTKQKSDAERHRRLQEDAYKERADKEKRRQQDEAERQRIIQQLIDDMVWVEGGTFLMGATTEQGGYAYADEFPVHQVTLSGFYISKYEVTNELWWAVMYRDDPMYMMYDDPHYPVEKVRWVECQKFIHELNGLTGKHFRLPTEAEWEYAARGGNQSQGYKYSGSNDIDEVAWYKGNSGRTTHSVGTKTPNELGLYDMSGNVDEWCQDWYGDYQKDSQTSPTGPSLGSENVNRGGSYFSDARGCRLSIRYCDVFHNGLTMQPSLRLANALLCMVRLRT